MALKVVPAGDERCDIHNRRPSPDYICEDCLKQIGIEPVRHVTSRRRRLRRIRPGRVLRSLRPGVDRRVLIGAAVLVILAIAAVGVANLLGGDDGEGENALPLVADVVTALNLVPDLSGGAGWITADGACTVLTIERGEQVGSGGTGVEESVEATNEAGTVGAVVIQNDFSISQQECVDRIDAALKAEF